MGEIQAILRHVHSQFIWPAEKALLSSHNPPLRGEMQCTNVYIRLHKLHSAKRQLTPSAVDWAKEKKSIEWVAKGRQCQFVGTRLLQESSLRSSFLISSSPVTILNFFIFRIYVYVHVFMCMCAWVCTCSLAQKTNLDFSSHGTPANSLGPGGHW